MRSDTPICNQPEFERAVRQGFNQNNSTIPSNNAIITPIVTLLCTMRLANVARLALASFKSVDVVSALDMITNIKFL